LKTAILGHAADDTIEQATRTAPPGRRQVRTRALGGWLSRRQSVTPAPVNTPEA
jgi:hypothetical protein